MEILIICIWSICAIIALNDYSFIYEYQPWEKFFLAVGLIFFSAPALVISNLVFEISMDYLGVAFEEEEDEEK